MASLVGQTLGQYQLIAQLGHGGMATVYKAYHARLDRMVAVKMVHPMFLQDQTFLTRFEREARIVAALDHPHIVPVYDFNEFNGQPYLVMKFIEGKTLKAVSNEKPLALNDVLTIMPPIADALDYAHRRGVLHRDIKPSNIMIDLDGVPYLTDFGLARMAKSGESSLSHDLLLGTPNYISPEQGQGKLELTPRADHYSLGVVLYEMLVGQVPFSADTPFAVVHSHIYQPPPVPSSVNPSIPTAVDAVVMRALAKTPDERYATATEMMEAFRSAVAEADMRSLNLRHPQKAPIGIAPIPAGDDAPTIQTPPPIPLSGSTPAEAVPPVQPTEASTASAVIPSPTNEATNSAAKSRRVVEASFDFGNVAQSVRHAGEQVKSAVERIAESQGTTIDWGDKGGEKAKHGAPPPNKQPEKIEDAIVSVVEGIFGNTDLDLASENDQSAARKRIEKQVKKRQEFFGHVVTYVIINALLWFIFLSASEGNIPFLSDAPAQAWEFPWPFLVSMGWGAGLLAHGVDTAYETGKRAARRLRVVRDAYRREYGPDWSHIASKGELKRIKKNAEQPFKKRQEFFTHLPVYLMINLMLWGIYLFANDNLLNWIDEGGNLAQAMDFPWPIFVTFGWGIGLVWNALEALTAGRQERAIEREMERERRILESEKPKRAARGRGRGQLPGADEDLGEFDIIDEPVRERRSERRGQDRGGIRLTEDGELTESMIMEIEDENERQRRTRR